MNNQDNQNREQHRRRRRRRRKKNNRVIGLLIFVLFLLLCLLGYLIYTMVSGRNDRTTETTTTTVTEETTPADSSGGESAPEASNEAATNENGEINTIGSVTDLNGLKQTLTSAVVSSTMGNTTAPEGQTFMRVDFTVDNTTATELGVNPNNYVAYANGNQVPRVQISDPTIPPMVASTVPAGGSINGALVFQIPDNWNEVQIYSHINPNVNMEVEYRITPDQL